jgi:hypothetical protein
MDVLNTGFRTIPSREEFFRTFIAESWVAVGAVSIGPQRQTGLGADGFILHIGHSYGSVVRSSRPTV